MASEMARRVALAIARRRLEDDIARCPELGHVRIEAAVLVYAALCEVEARQAIEAMREPTEAMLNAARDWSEAKYGKPIGSDAAIGCWQAMHGAVLEDLPPAPAG